MSLPRSIIARRISCMMPVFRPPSMILVSMPAVHTPPRQPALSISWVFAPSRAAAKAAPIPAGPAPTINTSLRPAIGISRAASAKRDSPTRISPRVRTTSPRAKLGNADDVEGVAARPVIDKVNGPSTAPVAVVRRKLRRVERGCEELMMLERAFDAHRDANAVRAGEISLGVIGRLGSVPHREGAGIEDVLRGDVDLQPLFQLVIQIQIERQPAIIIFEGIGAELRLGAESAFAAIIPLRHEVQGTTRVAEAPVQALGREGVERRGAFALELKLGAVDENVEWARPGSKLAERVRHVELRAIHARRAAVDCRADTPADITRVEPELSRVGGRRNAHRIRKEVFNLLEENARAEHAAALRVILEREIVVVGRPGAQTGIRDGDIALHHRRVTELFVFEIGVVNLRCWYHAVEVGPAVGLGKSGAGNQVFGDAVVQVKAGIVAV